MSERPLAAAISGLGVVDPAAGRGRRDRRRLRPWSRGVRDVAGVRRPPFPPRRAPRAARRIGGSARTARPRPRRAACARRRGARGCRRRRCRRQDLLDAGRTRRGTVGDRARVGDPRLDRARTRSRAAARLARLSGPFRPLAPSGHEVGELRHARRGRGRGEAARRRRCGARRPRRDGARGHGDERLVARGRRPRHSRSRARHPCRRDAGRATRARRRGGLHGGDGRLPARPAARRRRGLHLVVGAGGDARRRSRHARVRQPPRGGRTAAQRSAGSRAAERSQVDGRRLPALAAAARDRRLATLPAWRSYASAAWPSRTASSFTGRPCGVRPSGCPTGRSSRHPARSRACRSGNRCRSCEARCGSRSRSPCSPR